MATCEHKNLVLIKKPEKKLRCRHCYLSIAPEELESDFCPECFETDGIKRREFDEISEEKGKADSYRCESCGELIESE